MSESESEQFARRLQNDPEAIKRIRGIAENACKWIVLAQEKASILGKARDAGMRRETLHSLIKYIDHAVGFSEIFRSQFVEPGFDVPGYETSHMYFRLLDQSIKLKPFRFCGRRYNSGTEAIYQVVGRLALAWAEAGRCGTVINFGPVKNHHLKNVCKIIGQWDQDAEDDCGIRIRREAAGLLGRTETSNPFVARHPRKVSTTQPRRHELCGNAPRIYDQVKKTPGTAGSIAIVLKISTRQSVERTIRKQLMDRLVLREDGKWAARADNQ